ncbi:nitrogen fixation regulatory protein [bacterium BMS3Bbin09]|nr:nitrogen fixation regulatory protein [bacterium BMS3Bbin09]
MKKTNAPTDNLAEKYFNIAEVILVVINADQTVDRINQKGCKVLGYKEKDIVDKNWFDNFIPEALRKDVKAVFDKLINEKIKPVEYYENTVLTKNGEEKIIAWHNTILKDEKGKIVCTISSGEDITEQKNTEDELKLRSEITEQVKVSVLTTGLDFKINWVNQAFNALYGYSLDEVIGKTPDFLNIEPLSDEIQSDIYQTMFSGEAWMGEVVNRRKDGTTFLCELDIFPLKDKNGNIFAYAGHQHDITERKQIEEEILSVSNIPAENPNPVIRISSDKTILYANDSFNKLLTNAGLSEKDAIKILPDDLYRLIDIALEEGKPHIMIEAKAADRVISYNIIPIMEQGYVNLYGRDVTEHNKLERELKDKVKDLEQFYEMAVGRELKMKELKEEVKGLMVRLSKYE